MNPKHLRQMSKIEDFVSIMNTADESPKMSPSDFARIPLNTSGYEKDTLYTEDTGRHGEE